MKDIQRVNLCHTLNIGTLSILSIYIPAYLLTLGFSLQQVIWYFALAPLTGLLLCFTVIVPLMRRFGLINTFKLYYPLQIVQLFLLFILQYHKFPLELAAIAYGAANYMYWIPLNLLFVKHSPHEDMGSNVSQFFALPQLLSIIGPLIGALLIPVLGFWPVFIITVIGLIFSYIPLVKVQNTEMAATLNFTKSWQRIKRNKSLFLFEAFDNVLEESDWFWGIYVYLIIGSLSAPGIVGSLSSLGGSLFTLLVGKYANRHDKKLIPAAASLLLLVNLFRMVVHMPLSAYVLTLVGSFIFTLFIVSYFSTIFRTIKGEGEEEFMILREIPVVLGRMIVFGAIILTIENLKYFFVTPILFLLFLLLLYYVRKKIFYSQITPK